MVTRENNKKRMQESGQTPKQRGRKPAVTLQSTNTKTNACVWKMNYCGIFSAKQEVKPSVKYRVIFRHKDRYCIKEMCGFFKVSRSGYYDFIKRMDKPDSDAFLADLINTCQIKTLTVIGGRRYRFFEKQVWLSIIKRF